MRGSGDRAPRTPLGPVFDALHFSILAFLRYLDCTIEKNALEVLNDDG